MSIDELHEIYDDQLSAELKITQNKVISAWNRLAFQLQTVRDDIKNETLGPETRDTIKAIKLEVDGMIEYLQEFFEEMDGLDEDN